MCDHTTQRINEIKLNSNGTVAKVDNLWIASGQVNQFPNLLGSILQSQFVLSSLGFGEVSVTASDVPSEHTENIQENSKVFSQSLIKLLVFIE